MLHAVKGELGGFFVYILDLLLWQYFFDLNVFVLGVQIAECSEVFCNHLYKTIAVR